MFSKTVYTFYPVAAEQVLHTPTRDSCLAQSARGGESQTPSVRPMP
jgi:hypothetical protein